MPWPFRLSVTVLAALGGVSASQFPEFAQQYRQRLGGGLDELRQVIADFDADAARNGLTRQEAMLTYGESAERFFRDRGMSMQSAIGRLQSLEKQRENLGSVPPFARPLVVLSSPDRRIVSRAWSDFEPAVPVTFSGFAWGGLGLIAGGGLAFALGRLWRRMAGRRKAPAEVERRGG
ncbi:MAG TPA: DUF2937 family protein [Afifellaceae bacterium]|nr:DUF2937 family protein [Afifellaceae bacterium]